jgi:hypothetical protein
MSVGEDDHPVARAVLTACDLDGTPIVGIDTETAVDLIPEHAEVTLVFVDEDPAAALGELYAVHIHGQLRASTVSRHALRFGSRHAGFSELQILTPWITAVTVVAPNAQTTALEPGDYRLEIGDAPELTANEKANLEHQNQDHLDISEQLVTHRSGSELCRLPFEQPAFDRPALGTGIKGYLKIARAQLGIDWNP